MNLNKKTIKQVVVVEGHSDTNKLKKLFNVDTIETNGSALDQNTINLIQHAANTRGVILMLDPDGPGEQIRKKISQVIDKFDNVFIDRKTINHPSKKIGIAEANDDVIIQAFDNIISFDKNINSISWADYCSLNLNTKAKRQYITNYYKISECNHKQLYKRLNMMNITFEMLKGILPNE